MKLDKLKKAELIEVAKEMGITRNLKNMTKAQIISEIEFMQMDLNNIFSDVKVGR
jgi:hypothetical protein